jgi:hypothetical protein
MRTNLPDARVAPSGLVHLTELNVETADDSSCDVAGDTYDVEEPVRHPHVRRRELAALNDNWTDLRSERCPAGAAPAVLAVHRSESV